MKILHVITTLLTGGAERLMVDLLPRLRDRGLEVELAVFVSEDTPFYQELQKAGIKIHRFASTGSVYDPRHIFRLRNLIRNFDVVHTHNTSPQLFAAIASLGSKVKLVTTEHNTTNRRRDKIWLKPIDRWMYGRYDCVVAIADVAADLLKNHLGPSVKTKIITIENGIDLSRFSNNEPSQEFKKWMEKGDKVIVMVAAFRFQKDQQTLIRAISKLPPKFHLFLAGAGNDTLEECKNLTKELELDGRVHFLGMRKDVPNLLRAADYVVMSSHYEGLSLSSVEGMSVGKPMLASDVPGLREVVGRAGILFPEGDSEALAAEILRLDSDPSLRESVAEACTARAARYDISRMADAYAELYHSLERNS